MNISLIDLLTRGYFPYELPPPFRTDTFANVVCNPGITLPPNFTSTKLTAKPCIHNLARPGTLRRPLGIPNPILQYNLCKTIYSHWNNLEAHFLKCNLSKSIPAPGPWPGRALVQTLSRKDLLTIKADARARSRYLLRADISRFYHSIYTHSLPWAIHTKAYAKANRTASILGNLLDTWSRNGQDGQTVEVPIGPDTSFLLAEVLLTSADEKLVGKIRPLHGVRYIDDYELGFPTRAAAEEAMAALQGVLSEYELALNPKKTVIIEMPTTLQHPWTSEISSFAFRSTARAQGTDIVRFFDRCFVLAKENPEDPVLRYALARLKSIELHHPNWDIFEKFLFQCVLFEPGTLTYALEHLFHYHHIAAYPVNLDLLDEVMNQQIRIHASVGHGSEVAWAIWTLITFSRAIHNDCARIISAMEDSVIALLALDANSRGLVPTGLDVSNWGTHMDEPNLYGEHWLLSYEANVKGWLPSSTVGDHVNTDTNFSVLKKAGVEFYDRERPLKASPSGFPPYLG